MHTHYIKVYHEINVINVPVVQKHKLKTENCLTMQVIRLRIKISNLLNGLRSFFDFCGIQKGQE